MPSILNIVFAVFCILWIVHSKATNPFEANLRKRIDPEDEMLKRALWAGARDNPYEQRPPFTKSANRVPKSTVITYSLRQNQKRADFKPLIGFPSCLKCAGKARFDGSLSYDDFTPEKMVDKIILGGRDGACLFYGQREKGATPSSLSGSADQLGCLMSIGGIQTRAIWNMWPQDKEKSCEVGKNYYCLNAWEPTCCWLNPLMDGQTIPEREAKTRPYFRAMSAAMAMTCTDTVYLLHEHPQDLGYQPIGQPESIWITDEVKVLKRLYAKGVVKTLKVIPANQEGKVLTYDSTKWVDRTDELKKPVKRDSSWTEEMANAMKVVLKHHEARKLQSPNVLDDSALKSLNFTDHSSLQQRWSVCAPSAANQEDPHLDYFG